MRRCNRARQSPSRGIPSATAARNCGLNALRWTAELSSCAEVAGLMEWILAIEASGPADWMRTSSWAYPAVNLLHVAGVILLVGGMLLLDLRILGAGRKAISLHNRSEEHTSELQSRENLVCRLLLEKKNREHTI